MGGPSPRDVQSALLRARWVTTPANHLRGRASLDIIHLTNRRQAPIASINTIYNSISDGDAQILPIRNGHLFIHLPTNTKQEFRVEL